MSAREVCEEVEDYIRRQDAEPAFPCNFSVDEVAAHYTPGVYDDIRLKGTEVVKIDVGAHIDGYIADTAKTVDLSGKYSKLLEASYNALEGVVEIMKPDIRIYDIGKTVEAIIKRHGYKPVKNLTGHTIGHYMIHAGTSIPNYPDRTTFYRRLRVGTLVAVEPFATNGKGLVKEGKTVNIFSLTGRKPRAKLTSLETEALSIIIERFKTLPFTARWLEKDLGEKADQAVRGLYSKGILHGYPILVEAGKGIVSQFEHTFLLLKNKVIVTTRV